MIRPTFLAFETAKKALNTSQAGLDTVGHNIANVNTPGYTRQRVDQVSMNTTYRTKYQVYGARGHNPGMGAEINGINQVRDPYLDTRYRNEASTYGELAIKSNGLTDLENVLDEISTTGLYNQLGSFVNEITKYAQQADSAELAVVVRSAAQQVAQVLNKNARELQTALDQQMFDLNVAARDEVNNTLEQIAYLNTKIREDNMYGDPSNELNDQRNLLFDTLAEYLPIQIIRTPEQIGDEKWVESVSIRLVSASGGEGHLLVDNDVYNQIGVNNNEDGSVSISLIEGRSGFPLIDDITDNITGGGIKGYIDIINGKGAYAGKGENTFRGIPYYMKALDTFAETFAGLMNAANSISAYDAQGKETITEYPDKNLFTAGDKSTPLVDQNGNFVYDSRGNQVFKVTANNISLSEEWLSEATYITTSKQDPSKPVPLLDSEGNQVYDSNDPSQPVYVVPANSDNLLIFKALLTDKDKHFMGMTTDGEEFTLFRGSFEESLVSIQSTCGLDKKLNDSLLNASDVVFSGYADLRDSISAVSVDEEAINMMTYQNYYNAAARYMTVIDEALGTIIQGMGVVGR